MRHRAVLLIASFLFSAPLHAQEPSSLVGTWEGDLDAGGVPIPTVLHLALDEDGELTGTADSPKQNAFGLEISEVRIADDGEVTIVLAVVGARYVARLEDGKLVGEWIQRGGKLPLVCTKKNDGAVERVPGQERFVGSWEGPLFTGSQRLRVLFHLKEDPTGRLVGTMDSPDQGARGIPVNEVTVDADGHLEVDVAAVGGRYVGDLGAGGDAVDGALVQGGLAMPLDLVRTEKEERRRPQTPKPPFPYSAQDVTYRNDAADVSIAGTLTIPVGDGPFPAVLLITGSGPQDRDETLFDHKPFLVLADHLTRRGVAVLRVDDRGVGGTAAGSADATSVDFAGDVLAGVRFLMTRSDVDPARVGLIGHSEGGLIAPMVAERAPDEVAFIVLLAGPGVTGEEILLAQAALLTAAEGGEAEAIDANRLLQEKLFAVLKEHPDASREELSKQLRAALVGAPGLPEGDEGAAIVDQQVRQLSSAWMRFFLTYDPRPTLRRVRCPVLALNGELDLQVPVRLNLDAIEAALRDGGHEEFEVRALPSLNHLFQTCETGAFSEYDAIEETFAPAALDAIAVWITERTRPAR